MKIVKSYKEIFIIATISLLMACSKEEKLTESQLDTSIPQLSPLDSLIKADFIDPYNIEMYYKWNQNTVDNNRFLFPPTESKVIPALDVVNRIWINTYNTVGSTRENDFIKRYAPREFVLIGGVNLNPTGTILLGTADQGMRITLFQVDNLNKRNRASVNRFIQTVQHEYAHILTQNVPFDEAAFAAITPAGYTSNWNQLSLAAAREKGFITQYAQDKAFEDFAEMIAIMLTNSEADYNAMVNGITDEQAKAAIRAKEAQVVKYYREAFNIDFYRLRDVAQQNTLNVINN